ncbi:dihydroxyacetone kinase subunit DhaK [Clostridium tagluense]|nr:dihydroxyacetone kinase subunit DhaK [Clostridium tagluense]MBW9156887.1 dihydroxyacetone kinase subunit DhaK [Clostridium tagluense]WLC66363.1 dihydroxyacetone kinase subunit DhaK [Clostridium tagluense]
MKKIINNVDDMVLEMCKGMVKAHPDKLVLSKKYKIIKRKNLNQNKVSLISGGGSGHEPAHAGFVGTGMLDAAVCGDVFASPSTIQVYNSIIETQSKKGTLLIIKNYSGDCMNFDGAAEMALEDDDIKVEKVYVNDDVAVKDSLYTVGRRGVAGTVLIHKIAGAAAEQGMNLLEVKDAAREAIANVRTIGFAFTSCTVPAKGTPTFVLGEDEMEFGVGIHGEPGIAREKIVSSDELADKMLTRIIEDLKCESGDEIALLVNGFGATPLQELYILNGSANKILEDKNIKVYRTLIGNYMTAIDMAGASISVLKLNDKLKGLLDFPTDTPALKF